MIKDSKYVKINSENSFQLFLNKVNGYFPVSTQRPGDVP